MALGGMQMFRRKLWLELHVDFRGANCDRFLLLCRPRLAVTNADVGGRDNTASAISKQKEKSAGLDLPGISWLRAHVMGV